MTISIKQPLWLAGAVVLGLVTNQGPAVAQTLDCAEGSIQGSRDGDTVVDEIIIDGRSCVVAFIGVRGDVTVTNSEEFTMNETAVLGNVTVTNGRNARLISNDIGDVDTGTPSEVIVKGNENAVVILNSSTGSIKVNKNNKAIVAFNAAPVINCTNNGRLQTEDNEFEEGNCVD